MSAPLRAMINALERPERRTGWGEIDILLIVAANRSQGSPYEDRFVSC